MFSRSLFHHRQLTCARAIALCALLLIAALAMSKASTPRSHASSQRQTLTSNLTFEDRVAAQRTIEAVYWRQGPWLQDNNPQETFKCQLIQSELGTEHSVAEATDLSQCESPEPIFVFEDAIPSEEREFIRNGLDH